MIGDFFNLLFRSGIPYDAEKNEFRVRPEDAARIEFQRELMEQENSWTAHNGINNQFWGNND